MFTLLSGTTNSMYDMLNVFDVFLVNTLGWTRLDTLASGVSNLDRVYHNDGGETGNPYSDIYARWKTVDTSIYQYSYSDFNPTTHVGLSELGGTPETANYGTSVSGCTYWFIGDRDVAWLVLESTISGTFFSSSIGYCDSYYTSTIDPLPVCVVGHLVDTRDFTGVRVLMRNSSGVSQEYFADNYFTPILSKGNPQARDSRCFSMPILLYNNNAGSYEIRGEMKGIKQVDGSNYVSGRVVPLVLPTSSGNYLVIRHGDGNSTTYAYGPVIV